MSKKSIGAKVWLIPDSYLPERHNGEIQSHETVCVLNLGHRPAKLKFTFYFEDRGPIRDCVATCPPERTVHLPVKRLKGRKGESIPQGKSMAYVVESNVKVVVQHTRVDSSQAELALMTTLGYRVK
jgi:hypothetical protein